MSIISCRSLHGLVCEGDGKNAHLLTLDGAEERLSLCRTDVLDWDSLRAAFSGCRGVFHVASPISNDPVSSPAAASYING